MAYANPDAACTNATMTATQTLSLHSPQSMLYCYRDCWTCCQAIVHRQVCYAGIACERRQNHVGKSETG